MGAESFLLQHERIGSFLDQHVAFNLSRTIVEQLIDPESGQGELDKAREHLKTGSLVVFFGPHSCSIDPMLVNDKVIIPELRGSPDQAFAWILSVKFTGHFPGVTFGMSPEIVKRHAVLRNMDLLDVVQPYLIKGNYDDDGVEGTIDPKEAFSVNLQAFRRATRLLTKPGTIIGISPEATRRQTGGVHRGLSTAGDLINSRRNPNLAVLPIYIDGAHVIQHPSKKGLHGIKPFASVRLKVGRLATGAELEELTHFFAWRDREAMGEFTLADAMMMHLLNRPLSPWVRGQDPRGVYAWDNINDLRLTPVIWLGDAAPWPLS